MTGPLRPIKERELTSVTKTEKKQMTDDATGVMTQTPGDGPKGHHPSPCISTKTGSSLRSAPLIIFSPGKKLHNRTLSKKGGEGESRGITIGLQQLRRIEERAGVTAGKDR